MSDQTLYRGMREILFRGRDRSGVWNVGNLLHLQCETRGEVTTEVVKIHPVKINGADFPVVVDPDTVGQYTGLTDKKGAKIFEGDIVALPRYDGTQDTRVVIYNPARARFVRRRPNNLINEVDEYVMNRGCCEGYEVIGNIHDNPELLEVDE